MGQLFLLRGTAEKLKILPDGAKVAVYVIKYRVFLAFVFVTSNNSMHRCVMAQQMLIELISRVMAMGDMAKGLKQCRACITSFLFCLITSCGHVNGYFVLGCTEIDGKMDELLDSIGFGTVKVHFACFIARQSQNLPLFLHNTMVTPFGGHFVTEISLGKVTRH